MQQHSVSGRLSFCVRGAAGATSGVRTVYAMSQAQVGCTRLELDKRRAWSGRRRAKHSARRLSSSPPAVHRSAPAEHWSAFAYVLPQPRHQVGP